MKKQSSKKCQDSKGKQCSRQKCIFTLCLSVAFVFLLLLSLTTFFFLVTHHSKPNKELGVVNNTIIVATYSSFWYSSVSVSECLQINDYTHVNRIGLVRKDRQITHVTDYKLNQKLSYEPDPLSTTGLIDYLYLLKGSSIYYHICLASKMNSNSLGTVFIFDDETKYIQYTINPEEGIQLSVYSQSLKIGHKNQTVCTDIQFEVTETSYYFIMAQTPGEITFKYDSVIHQLYLDHNDFDYSSCVASVPAICEIDLPGRLFSNEEYNILAYVEIPVAADPFKTHICVTPHLSQTIIVITAVSGTILGLCLLGFISIFGCFVLNRCHKRRKRRGYVRITDIQGG